MGRIKLLWAHIVLLYSRGIEHLYLRTMQSRTVYGTDPDDGERMTLSFGLNDPHTNGFGVVTNQPLVLVKLAHTRFRWYDTRMVMSPGQTVLLDLYLQEAIGKQAQAFGYTYDDAPEFDTRLVRVIHES